MSLEGYYLHIQLMYILLHSAQSFLPAFSLTHDKCRQVARLESPAAAQQ